ncbi:VWA domain-containing protein [Paludisphaera rhizosphaerae]|uniref:VWA domain-containing protein n=1 Tax=Paludisphaera rhizosphaerae TaxID=2711216 RepID=UPI0013EC2C94|nr:VWA domain-containing protein [Paludisphaera rhizosphaerae]
MERRFSPPSSDEHPVADVSDYGLAPRNVDDHSTATDGQLTLVVDDPLLAPQPRPPVEGAEAAPRAAGSPAASEAAGSPAPAEGGAAEPRVRKLQPKRKRRVRLKHILPAWSVSLFVHMAMFAFLGLATVTSVSHEAKPIDFDSALGGADRAIEEAPIMDDPVDERPDRLEDRFEMASAPTTETMSADERPDIGSVVATGALKPSATPSVRGPAPRGGAEARFASIEGLKGKNISALTTIPSALGLDVSVNGHVGGDPTFGVSEIGDALNQLTREILRHLENHKVTVVWLFDESASMRDDQKAIAAKFDRVSSELGKYVGSDKKAAGALNHAIVGFGKEMDFVLDKPTFDIDVIRRAIGDLRIDSTGEENTMQAIRETVGRYSGLVSKDRKLLLVLVTDESGDDGKFVEEAIESLKKTKTALYVIGRQAAFGYPFVRHKYVDQITKDVYFPTIRRGPESADVECYQWDGLYTRWDEQPSGFAPWELARLTKDSGGIYFLLPSEESMRIRQRDRTYSIEVLKEYMPEYVSRAAYSLRRDDSELRRSLYALVVETRDFSFRREFPIEPDALRQTAAEQIEGATVRLNILEDYRRRLAKMKKFRDREPERRWRAHYDLMLAQTVAYQVKTYEYRALMEKLVNAPQKPKKQSTPDVTNTFVVDHAVNPVADPKITAEKIAEAKKLLNDVIAEYPNTPWSDLAADVLARGFSVVLNEWSHSPKYQDRSQFVPKF